KELATLGTSCPDHFLRTRVCPMFLDWNPAKETVAILKDRVRTQVVESRDSNPSVVIIPGLGVLGFGKNKKEARIAIEFFINAIHVMAGANALEDGKASHPLPQARTVEKSKPFTA